MLALKPLFVKGQIADCSFAPRVYARSRDEDISSKGCAMDSRVSARCSQALPIFNSRCTVAGEILRIVGKQEVIRLLPVCPSSGGIKLGAVGLFVFEGPSGAPIILQLTRLGPVSLAVTGYLNSRNFSTRCPYFLVITPSAWTNNEDIRRCVNVAILSASLC